MNQLIEVYNELIDSDKDKNINFLDSLDYLNNGLRLVDYLLQQENVQYLIISGYKSKNLYDEDGNEFRSCIIRVESGNLSESSNVLVTLLNNNEYKIELQ